MAYYMMQVAFTPEAWATLIKNPQDRVEATRPALQSLGGDYVCGFYSFGEYDTVLIVRMPDNVTVAAASVAVSAGGAARAVKTTPLMTMEEGIEFLRKAGTTGYRPPTS